MLGFFAWGFFLNIFTIYRKYLLYNLVPCGDKIPAPALHFNIPVSPLLQAERLGIHWPVQ